MLVTLNLKILQDWNYTTRVDGVPTPASRSSSETAALEIKIGVHLRLSGSSSLVRAGFQLFHVAQYQLFQSNDDQIWNVRRQKRCNQSWNFISPSDIDLC